ncbi:MAG: PRC-barrel domain-containing protein [Longimicrobiales bacterium]
MARDERVRRDAAGVGPDPEFSRRLYPIDELKDYRIASGEPDVRGWEVRTLNGREVGEVEDLLIDPARGEVVMLEVDLDRSGRHVSVPLRSVQLDRERNYIIVDSGDLGSDTADVFDTRTRDRMTDEDRRNMDDDVRDARTRDVRYGVADRYERDDRLEEERLDREVRAADRDLDRERTDESQPVVEEVVVRRRIIDPDAAEKDRLE